jgi:flagellar biosynthesis chaperone FliJ
MQMYKVEQWHPFLAKHCIRYYHEMHQNLNSHLISSFKAVSCISIDLFISNLHLCKQTNAFSHEAMQPFLPQGTQNCRRNAMCMHKMLHQVKEPKN